MKRSPRTRELPFTIQKKTTVIDSAGDPTTTWTNTTKIWAALKPLNDREILALGGQLNEYWYQLNTKFYPNITHKDRLVSKNIFYSIESIKDPVGDRMYLELKIKQSTPSELAAT